MTSNNNVPSNQGLDQESGLRSKKPVSAFGVVLVVLLGVLGIGVVLPSIGHVPRSTPEMVTSTNLRSIHQAMIVYAHDYEDRYPSADRAFAILLEQELIYPEQLVSPFEDGDGISYILIGLPEMTFWEDLIFAYEDPKHRKKGVTVVFDDNHVELVPHAEFEALLASQRAEQALP